MLTASHSETDLDEAEGAGARAVELALGGVTDAMVTLVRESEAPYRCGYGHAPLERVANRVRYLSDDYLRGHEVTEPFRRYAEPLMGAPLPVYPRLRKRWATP